MAGHAEEGSEPQRRTEWVGRGHKDKNEPRDLLSIVKWDAQTMDPISARKVVSTKNKKKKNLSE